MVVDTEGVRRFCLRVLEVVGPILNLTVRKSFESGPLYNKEKLQEEPRLHSTEMFRETVKFRVDL